MRAFDIGMSALRTHQTALTTLGHNIANASTPGYHRQRVDLINRPPTVSDGHFVGTGVDISSITRLRNSAAEKALLRNSGLKSYSSLSLDLARQIEAQMTPGELSIHSNLSAFFNRMEKIANAPQDLTVRKEFLTSASELMQGFNTLDQSLQDIGQNVRGELSGAVDKVNQLIGDIAAVNARIFESRGIGSTPNDLLDRRDQLITELSEYIDVEVESGVPGRETMIVGGSVAVGQRAVRLELTEQPDGRLDLTLEHTRAPIPLTAGKLRAMLEYKNEIVPAARSRVDDLARQIVLAVDQQHAKGMPDSGAFRAMFGQRAVSNVTVPLAEAETAFPVRAGNIYITVTERTTGVRRTEKVFIDPATDSLQSVAAKFDALAGVAASVDSVRNTISINGEPAYLFDFAGRADNFPDNTLMTGTTVPRFSGGYTGSVNDQWTVSFSGPGTIGLTPGLQAFVRDQAGQVIAVHDVGAGYEAGKPLTVRDGLSLQFSTGTVNASDQSDLYVTTNSDETDFLGALGLNSLFDGSHVGALKIRTEILKSPQDLSGGVTGTPGDATNVARIAAIRDQRFGQLGGRTILEELADMTADAGLDVQAAESRDLQFEALRVRLEGERDSTSGVDINEEMLKMMEVERGYQAASRFISTVNQTLDELFRIVQ